MHSTPAKLEASDADSEVQQLQDLCDEGLSEEQLQRRIKHIEVGKATKEYHFFLERKGRVGSCDELQTPDPLDSNLHSRRSWHKAVEIWRAELRLRHLSETEGLSSEIGPEAASAASTEAEETQSNEADDSITEISDDMSSAHWSSR